MTTLAPNRKKVDILIKQGATFGPMYVDITNDDGTAADLTGVQARAQVRLKYSDAAPLLTMTTSIVGNQVYFSVPATDSAALTLGDTDTKGVWDLEIEWPSGQVDSPFYGEATITPEVTK